MGVDNGADAKGNKWPPEELNYIFDGGNFGYPFAYGQNKIDKSREDPPGDSKKEWIKNATPSTATFNEDEVWVMNAKFNELVDSNAVPSQIFAIQKVNFKPVPKRKLR